MSPQLGRAKGYTENRASGKGERPAAVVQAHTGGGLDQGSGKADSLLHLTGHTSSLV